MPDIPTYDSAASRLSRAQKVGQLFMPAAFINDSEAEIQKLETLIKEKSIGGLCFFHSRASAATNFEGPKKVIYNEQSLQTLKKLIARYQRAAEIPLLIGIDAEWGLAMRIENTPKFPYAITLGALQDGDALIYEMGRHIASDCIQAGIHWNFAPVADINLNPLNPVIGYRSFGENKENVADKALALMKGMQDMGLLTCAKHFPGHGDTAMDSHLGLPVIDKTWEGLMKEEFFPFKKLIEGGVEGVMVGHLAVPSLNKGSNTAASVSEAVIKGVLRQDLGFGGVVVSDALNMHSVSRLYPEKGRLEWEAFNAGNDVLCFAEHPVEGIDTILNEASEAAIELAFQRFWDLKTKGLNPLVGNKSQLPAYSSLLEEMAAETLTVSLEPPQALDKSGFTLLEVSELPGQVFQETLKQELDNLVSVSIKPMDTSLHGLGDAGPILIALYPPSVKPPNRFGFSEQLVSALNRLLAQRNVVIYNFGNPYVLNLFRHDLAAGVVHVYQDFESFQKNAATYFLGRSEARGRLPVTLKTFQDENL